MKKYIATLIALSALLSCDIREAARTPQEPEAPQREEGVMYFEPVYPGSTKATETAFEQGDVIGLYVTDYQGETAPPLQISGNWANNVAATLEGTEWVTAKKIFWSDNRMDAYGYYPYMSLTSVDEQPFSIALDQSTERTGDQLGGYEASDFLWAKTEGVDQSTETVTLQFSHRCSKLVIQLVKGPSYEGELPDSATVYIHNVVPTATIDLATGAVTKDIFGEVATVKARKVNNATYEAIMIPQRIESRRPFIEIVVNNISYLLEDTFQFKAGMQHTLSLVINSNPDQVSVDIGGEIVDGWN